MSYQFSIWLDEKTAKDLDALSCFEMRKRGAMIKVLIRRAAKELPKTDVPPITYPSKGQEIKKGGMNVSG